MDAITCMFLGDGRRLAAYAAPAAARAELWRVVLCLALVAGALLVAGLLIGLALVWLNPGDNPLARPGALSSPTGVVFALATFLLWWPALVVAMLALHRRGLMSLFPPTQPHPRRLFALGFAAALIFAALTILPGLALSPVERGALAPGDWAAGLLLAVPLLIVQTGAEELVFRGYLLQQMAARFRSPLAWAVAPSILFGLLHFNPAAPGGAATGMIVPAIGGLILAIVTARTGGIAAAWGLHFGVNLVALLIIAPPDHLSGLGFWRWSGPDGVLTILAWIDAAAILLIGLAAALVFSPSRRGG